MAMKQLKALKDFRYGTRMLRAGDPVEMDGPMSRFYTALGAVGPRDAAGSGNLLPRAPAAPVAPKAAAKPTRKRTAKRATKKA